MLTSHHQQNQARKLIEITISHGHPNMKEVFNSSEDYPFHILAYQAEKRSHDLCREKIPEQKKKKKNSNNKEYKKILTKKDVQEEDKAFKAGLGGCSIYQLIVMTKDEIEDGTRLGTGGERSERTGRERQEEQIYIQPPDISYIYKTNK